MNVNIEAIEGVIRTLNLESNNISNIKAGMAVNAS